MNKTLQKTLDYLKEWRKKNPQKARKYVKNWKAKNAEKVRNDARKYQKSYRERHPDRVRESRQNWYKNNPEKVKEYQKKRRLSSKYRYDKYKYGAKSRGYSFLITYDEFLHTINSVCHYCGSTESIGVDRKDNSIGYEIENCFPCCSKCNYFKGAKDYNDFTRLCIKIGKHLG